MTNNTDITRPVIEDLRFWAAGMYNRTAAVELLIRAFDGRFAHPGNPWIQPGDEYHWLNAELIESNIGALSGGERRVLLIVAALADGDLGDCVAGLDRENLSLVLAAIAHTGGSHEHPGGTLYPWPEATS